VLESPEAREYLAGKGYEIAGGTPEAFGAYMQAEREKWARAARLAGV